MLFILSYSIIDGLFISNFIGTDGLASMNILLPAVTLVSGLGFMFATGGSTYDANLMGRGDYENASRSLSLTLATATAFGVLFAIVGLLVLEPTARLLGANDLLMPGSVDYGHGYLPFIPFLMLQFLFTQFLIVAGKPGISLAVSIGAGITYILLDYLLIVVFDFGLIGAAVASGISSLVPAAVGIGFFLNRKHPLRLTKPSKDVPPSERPVPTGCRDGIGTLGRCRDALLQSRNDALHLSGRSVGDIHSRIRSVPGVGCHDRLFERHRPRHVLQSRCGR